MGRFTRRSDAVFSSQQGHSLKKAIRVRKVGVGALLCLLSSLAAAGDFDNAFTALGIAKQRIQPKGSTLTTDISDLWFNPAESGWGIQFVESNNVVFATMFVYDAAGKPTWYVALLTYAGNLVWTGDVLATNGSYFGGPFVTGTSRKVGTMTFTGELVHTGTLSYTIDGVSVTKAIQRQTLVNEDYSGTFAGLISLIESGCVDSSLNGTLQDAYAAVVSQSGTTVSFRASTGSGVVCNYTGTLTQHGRVGSIDGSYSCSSTGEVGMFSLFDAEVNITALTGRLATTSNVCTSGTGQIVLMRR